MRWVAAALCAALAAEAAAHLEESVAREQPTGAAGPGEQAAELEAHRRQHEAGRAGRAAVSARADEGDRLCRAGQHTAALAEYAAGRRRAEQLAGLGQEELPVGLAGRLAAGQTRAEVGLRGAVELLELGRQAAEAGDLAAEVGDQLTAAAAYRAGLAHCRSLMSDAASELAKTLQYGLDCSLAVLVEHVEPVYVLEQELQQALSPPGLIEPASLEPVVALVRRLSFAIALMTRLVCTVHQDGIRTMQGCCQHADSAAMTLPPPGPATAGCRATTAHRYLCPRAADSPTWPIPPHSGPVPIASVCAHTLWHVHGARCGHSTKARGSEPGSDECAASGASGKWRARALPRAGRFATGQGVGRGAVAG